MSYKIRIFNVVNFYKYSHKRRKTRKITSGERRVHKLKKKEDSEISNTCSSVFIAL